MGAESQRESHYLLHSSLQQFHIRDTPQVKYYWLNKHVNESHNCSTLSVFNQHATVYPYNNYETLKVVLSDPGLKQYTIRVIVSASMENQVYQELQNNPLVEKIILYCRYKPKANNLRLLYPKIQKVCYDPLGVVKVINHWFRQQEQRLIGKHLNSREDLNKWNVCYLGLTRRQQISRNKANKDMKVYMAKVGVSHDTLDPFWNQYLTAIERKNLEPFVINCALKNECVFQLLNQLCQCTRNPTKLAYCRIYACDLYHSIASQNKKLTHDQVRFTSVIQINDSEKRMLLNDKMFTFCGFLRGENRYLSLHKCSYAMTEAKLNIIVPSKGGVETINAGYVFDESTIVFNPGNYFEIVQVETYQGSIEATVKLVSFSDQIQSFSDPREDISISESFIRHRQSQYPGQLLSLKYCFEDSIPLTVPYLNDLLESTQDVLKKMQTGACGSSNSQEKTNLKLRLVTISLAFQKINDILKAASLKRILSELGSSKEAFEIVMEEACEFYCRDGLSGHGCLDELSKIFTFLSTFEQWEDMASSSIDIFHIKSVLKRVQRYHQQSGHSLSFLKDFKQQLLGILDDLSKQVATVIHPAYRCCLILLQRVSHSIQEFDSEFEAVQQLLILHCILFGSNSKEAILLTKKRQSTIQRRERARNEDLWINEQATRREKYQSKVEDISHLFSHYSQSLNLQPNTRLDMELFDPIVV